ncbi:MAG TPA: VWA domain-containing protein, partial [Candidatus Binatia bacterium]|nr:VWA domain-containing protein [Candidatus Binatia bacterium]
MFLRLPFALFLLAGAIPLILFLHSLKPRGLQVRTTTMFLWERVLRERPLGTRLGWLLRKNLLLILQLLAATALIAALADPWLRHFGSAAGDIVAVIDQSASMKAKGKNGARFEAARRALQALIDNLGTGQKMMIIGAGAQPRLLAPFSGDKRRLGELARGLEATDAPGRVKEAILFAHAFLKRGSPDRVVVISDGAFAGAEEFVKPAAQLRFITVEGGKDNVGIVGFEARRQPEHPSSAEIMVHVKNFADHAVRAPLDMTLGGKTLARQEIELGAHDRRVLIFPYDGGLDGRLLARLEINDDFATDNQAYLALADRAPLRVLYVGPGNPYLHRLLSLFSEVELSSAPHWEPELARAPQPYDVIIFDRVPAPALSRGNFIFIDTAAPNLPIEFRGKMQNPSVLSPLAKHPLTEGLSLADLRVREARRVTVKDTGTVLARAAEGPLIYALDQGNLRVLFLGFDLTASDLPLRVAFPILFHNAFEWFQPGRLEFPGQSAQAGAPVVLRLAQGDDALDIAAPSGRHERLSASAGPITFTDTFQAGFYTFKSAGRSGSFAVNLFDEAESDIVPRVNLAAASTPSAEPSGALESGFSLWPLLVGAV